MIGHPPTHTPASAAPLVVTPPAPPGSPSSDSRIKRFTAWLLALRGSPRQIAMGFALGVFVGCSPFWGLHMVIAAALATLFAVNRPAAIAAVWVSNPLTVIPIYAATYNVGHIFVSGRHPDSIRTLLHHAIHGSDAPWYNVVAQVQHVFTVGEGLLVPLLVGGVIVGLVAGCISYAAVRLMLRLLGRRSTS